MTPHASGDPGHGTARHSPSAHSPSAHSPSGHNGPGHPRAVGPEPTGEGVDDRAATADALAPQEAVPASVTLPSVGENDSAAGAMPPALDDAINAAVDALGTGIVVLDADGGVLTANAAAAAVLGACGYDLTGCPITDHLLFDSAGRPVPAADRPSTRSRCAGRPVGGVHQVRGRDGALRWVASTWHAAGGGNVVGTLRDVTDEQRTLQALAAARDELAGRERRLVSLLANSSDTTSIIDAEGHYIWAGDGVTRFGLDPEAILGTSALDGLHPEDLPSARVLIGDAVGRPGAPVTRLRLRWAGGTDGRLWYIDVTVTNLLDDPAIGGLVLNVRDATVQVETEAALRRQDLMFRAMLTHSHDELRVFSPEGATRYASPSAVARTGREYQLGDALHPDDRAAALTVFADVAATPGKVAECAYRVPGADGATTWMETRFANLLDDPAVRGIVATTRDVTARHREEVLTAGQKAALEAAAADAPLAEVLGGLCATVERHLETSIGLGAAIALLDAGTAAEIGGVSPHAAELIATGRYTYKPGNVSLGGDLAGPIAESPALAEVAAHAAADGLQWLWRIPVGGDRQPLLGTLIVAVPAGRPPLPGEREMLGRVADLIWALVTRDRAHREMLASEVRFRAAFANTGVPTALIGTDGRFEHVNTAMVSLFGYPADELIGATFRQLLAPDDVYEQRPWPESGDTLLPMELTLRRADGVPLQVVVHTAGIRDATGALVSIAVHYIDVTARRQSEEEVRLLNDLLCQRISELDTAQDRLAAAFRQVTQAREDERRQLAQNLHDDTIQNMLATLWSLDFLGLDEEDAGLADVRRALNVSIESTRKMIFELRPPVLDVQGLAAAIGQELDKLNADTGVTVALDSTLTGRVAADLETMAYRTVREALQNVRKHARATSVRVELRVWEDRLRVQVVDDGVGFDPAIVAARQAAGHYGVVSIRESSVLAGGDVYLGNRRDGQRGTELELNLPLDATNGGERAPAWPVADLGSVTLN